MAGLNSDIEKLRAEVKSKAEQIKNVEDYNKKIAE
jgi:hypothetical protein